MVWKIDLIVGRRLPPVLKRLSNTLMTPTRDGQSSQLKNFGEALTKITHNPCEGFFGSSLLLESTIYLQLC